MVAIFIFSSFVLSAIWLQLYKTVSATSPIIPTSRLFQSCETDAQCTLAGETCQTPLIGEGECVIPGTCVCLTSDFNFVFCNSDTNCNGTICAKEAMNNSYGVCLSCVDYVNLPDDSREALTDNGKCDNITVDRVTPSPHSTNHHADHSHHPTTGSNQTDVCVDVALLKHLPKDSLVYDTHFQASVLCDHYGSCTTPGHIVLYKGKPMMMRTYCKHVSCKRRVKYVNSPTMTRALRIRTLSPDLTVTAFAASYQSSVEEGIVSLLVKMGL